MIRVLALMLVLLPATALAKDDGRYANSPLHDWVKGLKSKRSGMVGCCDQSDGSPPEAVWDMGGGKYQVRIEGKVYDVPEDAVITEPNKLGYAVVWFYWQQNIDGVRVPIIRCFLPGTQG